MFLMPRQQITGLIVIALLILLFVAARHFWSLG
jgi:hypothetical protein